MSKNRKSNKEAKKKPLLSAKEKRAAKKSKNEENVFLLNVDATRKPKSASGAKRP